jgi:hypothetical protein
MKRETVAMNGSAKFSLEEEPRRSGLTIVKHACNKENIVCRDEHDSVYPVVLLLEGTSERYSSWTWAVSGCLQTHQIHPCSIPSPLSLIPYYLQFEANE